MRWCRTPSVPAREWSTDFEITQAVTDADGHDDPVAQRAPAAGAYGHCRRWRAQRHREAAWRQRPLAAHAPGHRHDGGNAGRARCAPTGPTCSGWPTPTTSSTATPTCFRRLTTSTSASAVSCRISTPPSTRGRTSCSRHFVNSLVDRGVLHGRSDRDTFTPFLIPVGGPLASTAFGRVLFAGDAGGFVNGITAEGIYYAMASGEHAARAVIDARQANRDDAGGRYERGWRAEIGAELADATKLQRFLFQQPGACGARGARRINHQPSDGRGAPVLPRRTVLWRTPAPHLLPLPMDSHATGPGTVPLEQRGCFMRVILGRFMLSAWARTRCSWDGARRRLAPRPRTS